ncbi:hypothetical protein [Nocardioides cavernaquae]|uniref:Uncharacterized protein n=1 Tax=Nocardioides cavernaquae TaxID=2321396 RepID=A0A3A5HFI8_9ACTN|nr:hypothetical protein [Nocardioides cavernaquae]RJS46557.1 hypothetical protein D4739_10260 [Nocardioides cavernaquae]
MAARFDELLPAILLLTNGPRDALETVRLRSLVLDPEDSRPQHATELAITAADWTAANAFAGWLGLRESEDHDVQTLPDGTELIVRTWSAWRQTIVEGQRRPLAIRLEAAEPAVLSSSPRVVVEEVAS